MISEELRIEVEEWLTSIIRPLVNHPEEVAVEIEDSSSYGAKIYLDTNPDDVRFVVGKNGHVISSLRSFVSAKGGKHKIRFELEYTTDLDQRDRRYNSDSNYHGNGYRDRGYRDSRDSHDNRGRHWDREPRELRPARVRGEFGKI